MWNSGWAVVVVVALVIVALFGYWAIEGDFDGTDTARIESDVNVNRGAPADNAASRSETDLNVNIERDRPEETAESRSETNLDVTVEGEREPASRSESRSELNVRSGEGTLRLEGERTQ